jgi:hypothetical protein
VSFDENSFGDVDLFPYIQRRRRLKLGRKGLSGGKLEILEDGIRWRAGSIATPKAEITGHFFLPWAKIARVDVSDAPNTIKALGGALTLYPTGGRGKIYGEFLGSRTNLLEALSSTPLGVDKVEADDDPVGNDSTVEPKSTPPFGKLSENGERFWNGAEWVSATSADGQMFWTGDHWSRHA